MPLQKGERGMPQPHANLLGYGDMVRVQLAPWQDAHGGQTGTVKRVRLRGADLHAEVLFGDGERVEYLETELLRTAVAPPRPHVREPKW